MDQTKSDISGTTVNGQTYIGKVFEAMNAVKQSTRERVQEALRKSPKFRKAAMKPWGLQNEPFCKSKKRDDIAQCDTMIGYYLNTAAATEMYIAEQKLPPDTDLEMLSAVSEMKEFRALSKEGLDQTVRAASDRKTETKLREEIIPEVTARLIEQIKATPMDEGLRQELIGKVSTMKVGDNLCTENNKLNVPSILFSSSYYSWDDGDKNTFRYCPSMMMRTTSVFQMVFVIAHEMSHSIDPCLVGKPSEGEKGVAYQNIFDREKLEAEYPWGNVLTCLRGEDSVKALSEPVTMVAGKSIYDFCKKDQIGEGFCDWMATEILSGYIGKHYKTASSEDLREGYANALRLGDCYPALPVSQGPHPAAVDRIDRIIAAHPQARLQMGCGDDESLRYCDNKKPVSEVKPGTSPTEQKEPAPAEATK